MIKTQFKANIKVFRFDNVKEFAFVNFLASTLH